MFDNDKFIHLVETEKQIFQREGERKRERQRQRDRMKEKEREKTLFKLSDSEKTNGFTKERMDKPARINMSQ